MTDDKKMERTFPFNSFIHKEICHGQTGCFDGDSKALNLYEYLFTIQYIEKYNFANQCA